ncbi:hypothetical protein QF046_001674 [Microbacterium sp. W4I4]|uniref:hypothetical protein n=1 Tax=Microbacterium sp. W4I4 TaxID=3042295 RepID=UPI00278AFC60|nr:hypothetical protein [Microbacterium sp. W4I4]MDQ0614033.1 hypothetical protein [Microbacterium sp. W4I4]
MHRLPGGADITEHEALREMLDSPVRVNGALVRLFLCDVYDGPFPSDQEKLGARLLRSAG